MEISIGLWSDGSDVVWVISNLSILDKRHCETTGREIISWLKTCKQVLGTKCLFFFQCKVQYHAIDDYIMMKPCLNLNIAGEKYMYANENRKTLTRIS